MSPGQFDGESGCVDLIQIDSKEQKEVHEINSIECAQCEQFVDARDPCGVLDLDQRTVGDAVSLVPLCTRDQAAIHCTSRPLMPRASRRALRRCPGRPGGFLDESARPRPIKVRYSTHGSVAIVPNVSNKRKNSIASYQVLTRTLAPPHSVVPSAVD